MIHENFEFIMMFERRIAAYFGAKYAVAVDSGSNAIFLAFEWLNCRSIATTISGGDPYHHARVSVPRGTYVSVPMQLRYSGFRPKLEHREWHGRYKFNPYPIWDCACWFKENSYEKGTLMCLSFGHKKPLAIGKGGMILTDSEEAWRWLMRASFDGRERMPMKYEVLQQFGWHMNMTPDDAVKGLMFFNMGKYDKNHPGSWKDYRDLGEYEIFKEYLK